MLRLKKGGNIVFTYIELENFKSFGKIKIDFKRSKKEAKKFIAIYGENGSGKSNLVSAVEFLTKVIMSFASDKSISKFLEAVEANDNNNDYDEFVVMNQLIQNLKTQNDATENFKQSRMIACDADTTVKYGFLLDGVEGYYKIVFNDKIICEELYHTKNKQRGILFNINANNGEIQKNFSDIIFKDAIYKAELFDKIDRYWGKHAFLSIFIQEIKDNNAQYVMGKLSKNLFRVVDTFTDIFILCKSSQGLHTGAVNGSEFNKFDFSGGKIEAEKEDLIDLIENIINDFFTQAYSDIVGVYYDKKIDTVKNKLSYKLFVKKMVANEIRAIPFSIESAGTQSVLTVLKALIAAVNGATVVYDEIDGGIHDLLMKNMLSSLQTQITGQLIITTHNTLLLETLDPRSAYVIYVDHNGNKDARCLADYNFRIQGTNNVRNLYLKGAFGGMPYVSEIDYSNMRIENDSAMLEETGD